MSGPSGSPLVLDGELTVQVAADLKALFLAAIDSGDGDLEVDLSAVSELDTAGLQLLLMLQRQADRRGRTLRLVDPSLAVQEVLALARLDLGLEPITAPAPSGALA